jgi:predicted signal transduction protein with EAL and GGDEF domain
MMRLHTVTTKLPTTSKQLPTTTVTFLTSHAVITVEKTPFNATTGIPVLKTVSCTLSNL